MLALTRLFPTVRTDDILRRIALMETNRRERAALRALPDTLLRDVGLDPKAARQEASRAYWDVAHRR